MDSPPRMKPLDEWIQGAGYKNQDMRYKHEGIRLDVRFRGNYDCDIVLAFQETTRL